MVSGDSTAAAINAIRLSVQLHPSFVRCDFDTTARTGWAGLSARWFVGIDRRGRVTGGLVPDRFHARASALEVGRRAVPWTGHCLRIGLASIGRKRGRNPIAVVRQGGWAAAPALRRQAHGTLLPSHLALFVRVPETTSRETDSGIGLACGRPGCDSTLLDSSAMRSREYDLDFRDRAGRIRAWGIGLLTVAVLQWAWCALLLLTPYEVDEEPGDRYPAECESRLLTERGTANDGLRNGDWCQNERDWPEALAVLGLSVPMSVAGVALFMSGSMSIRMSAHAEAMRELDKIADAPDA